MSLCTIRPMTPEDFAGVVALQRACFPAPFPVELLWNPGHLTCHLELFPEGQYVAERDGAIIGSASSIRIAERTWEKRRSWDDLTGGLDLVGHDPEGPLLYGVDISVHPEARKLGVGRRLYQARFQLVQDLGLEKYVTVCRIPDFRESGMDLPEEYITEVAWRRKSDRTLTALLSMGLTCIGAATGFMDDEESGHAGAILEWTP